MGYFDTNKIIAISSFVVLLAIWHLSFILIGISVYILLTNGLGSLTRDSLAVMSLSIITIGVSAYYLIKGLAEIDFSNKDGGND